MTSAYGKLAQLNPFRYRGYVWDEETGLYYLRSRYYDPAWGRFLNADGLIGKSKDLFCYCGNDPISSIDYDGRSGERINSSFGLVAYSLQTGYFPNRIEDTYFLYGKWCKLYNPQDDAGKGLRFVSVPKTIASGQSSIQRFSTRLFLKNIGTSALDSYGLLNLVKDSMIGIDATATIQQSGDKEPVAYVSVVLTMNYTEMELGVHAVNKVAKIGPLTILGKDEDAYRVLTPSGEEIRLIDTDGWLSEAINSIEMGG